ncbi:MAG: patatin-like phospholipase family protein [Raineya sp.]|jgi:predicted acylesterase/phospholipase RssA|nr:patatin-like phospholipase family protein [Raineya sp.]
MSKNLDLQALILQGGGALGAYQWGVLQAFEDQGKLLQPRIITGVSIGAVNGAVYLSGGVEGLRKLWTTLEMPTLPFIPSQWQAKNSKIANPNMYVPNWQTLTSPLTTTNLYDLAPFKKLLESLIDIDRLNKSPIKLVVEAVNVETGALTAFSNHDTEGISIDKIMASMSIPPNFAMMEIDNNFYWDGGLFSNMPLSPAINYLENLDVPKNTQVRRQLFVISLFRKQSPLPTNINEVSDRVKELIFESKLSLDKKFFHNMNSYVDLIHQIDAVLPENSPIKLEKAYQNLLNHKKIEPPVLFQYEAEGVEGTDDFTPASIDLRFRTGYRDALQFINH